MAPSKLPATVEVLFKINGGEPQSFGDPVTIDIPIKLTSDNQLALDLKAATGQLAAVFREMGALLELADPADVFGGSS